MRDLSIASIELPVGLMLFLFGVIFGIWNWASAYYLGGVTPAGTIMLAALPMLMGLQLLLSFLAYDIASAPKDVISESLPDK